MPSKWAKKLNLKAGEEVEVQEKANSLTISRLKISPESSFSLTIPSVKGFFKRLIANPYIRGYDIINIEFSANQL